MHARGWDKSVQLPTVVHSAVQNRAHSGAQLLIISIVRIVFNCAQFCAQFCTMAYTVYKLCTPACARLCKIVHNWLTVDPQDFGNSGFPGTPGRWNPGFQSDGFSDRITLGILDFVQEMVKCIIVQRCVHRYVQSGKKDTPLCTDLISVHNCGNQRTHYNLKLSDSIQKYSH